MRIRSSHEGRRREGSRHHLPRGYHKDLAGKKVVFHVKAKEIKCKELPKLDDDFAKDVSEYDTLKELKDSIKREITEQREQSAKYAVENELMEKVAANIECDIPDALIDEQCAASSRSSSSAYSLRASPMTSTAR